MGTRSARSRTVVETGRDRKALVADAGFSQVSFISALAGVVTAYGTFAVLAGLAVGVIHAVNADIDLASQWRQLGVAGGLVVAGLLFLAYLFGGYVAGRMARRSGPSQGVVVFVLGLAVAAGTAFLARRLGGADVASDNLRDLGIPTTASEWRDIATVAGVASLAAMFLGSLVGGVLGERWHAKLLSRALDPQVGAEAEARRDAERRGAEAEERRVAAYRRVRTTTPSRTRRVDRELEAGDGAGTRGEPVPAATRMVPEPPPYDGTPVFPHKGDKERAGHRTVRTLYRSAPRNDDRTVEVRPRGAGAGDASAAPTASRWRRRAAQRGATAPRTAPSGGRTG